jgi:multiple sugar transport system ATP-binding protein
LTTVLQVDNLCASYGKLPVLRNISFELAEAEQLVILGPTGAGKTTLLRTIAGLHAPDSGVISISGTDMTAAPPADRDVAMVFQNFSLYPDRTVRQNLAFPLQSPSSGLDPDEIERRIIWASELLRIEPLLDRPATQLSGGEMQRVAIGRAIVRRPRIFLFDEPLTNLDAKLRERLRVELIALQNDLGVPSIYVTHDQAEALSMAQRIVVLADGQIAQTGPPSDIYDRPVTPEVARQLGYPPMNFLDVVRKNGCWIGPSGENTGLASGAHTRARIGIRPENITPSGGAIDARIRVVEDLGATRILLVDWAGFALHILVDRLSPYRVGDTIQPLLNQDRLLVWPETQAKG